MARKRFVWKDRVRIYDTDSQGIVHYAGYYRFFTDAFEQFSRSRLGVEFPMLDNNIWFVVVESNARYYAPARLGDDLRTSVSVTQAGRKALRMSFTIYRKGTKICDGTLVQVAIDSKLWRAVEIPKTLAIRIRKNA